MYMADGKPIQVPYGRRNVNVTRLEMEEIVAGLTARIEALEALVKDEGQEDEPAEVDGEQPKPRRGRPPKEAQE